MAVLALGCRTTLRKCAPPVKPAVFNILLVSSSTQRSFKCNDEHVTLRVSYCRLLSNFEGLIFSESREPRNACKAFHCGEMTLPPFRHLTHFKQYFWGGSVWHLKNYWIWVRPSQCTLTFLGGPEEAQSGYSNTILDLVFLGEAQ